ncbi:MAG: tetratricopeptide repeat protein [Candidatus Krumholzibacteria bacterium]|nr:tetratricopeptide repeat protein [Candidatus Krumholzibacteria bacterium]
MSSRLACSRIAVLLLALLASGTTLAQVTTVVDTANGGGIHFIRPEVGDEMSDEEKISILNEKLLADPTDGKSWNDLGVIYATAEEYEKARDSFIRAVQTTPTEGDYHRNLGMVFSRLDMHEMAVAEFGQYRKLDQLGGRDYWRLIGGAQKQAGMIDEARATFGEGIKAFEPSLGPDGFRLVLQLNQLEDEQGDEQAVRTLLAKYTAPAAAFLRSFEGRENVTGEDGYREASAIIHNRVGVLVEDGKLMEDSGLFVEAAKLYETSYELAPERDDLLPRLVDCYLKQDLTLEAGVAARLARDEHPENSGTWIATGKVYEHTNKRQEAVEAYEKAYEIDELDDLRVAIGNLYMRMGEDQKASKWLKAGVAATDAKPEVVYNYAVSLMREKKYHAAIPSLRNVTRDLPDFYNGWLALAQCLQATKQYSAAIDPFQQAFNLQPEAKLAFHMGSMAQKSKQYDKSIESYQMAVALDPTYVKAQYNLALTYMGAKKYEEAAAAFEALVEMEGPTYRAYYSQGLSYYYLGKYDEALESYDLALVEKETVNVYNNVGLVYDKLGNKKEAAKWYKDAAALKGGS